MVKKSYISAASKTNFRKRKAAMSNTLNNSHNPSVIYPWRFASKIMLEEINCDTPTIPSMQLADLSIPIQFLCAKSSDPVYLIYDAESNIATIFSLEQGTGECEIPSHSTLSIYRVTHYASAYSDLMKECKYNYIDPDTGEICLDNRTNYSGNLLRKATIAYVSKSKNQDLREVFSAMFPSNFIE